MRKMPVFIVIVNFLFLVWTIVVQAQAGLSAFERLESPKAETDGFLALETPLMSRKVSNKIDCAGLCNDVNWSDCTALEFDEHSRNCTVGVGLITVKGMKSGQTKNVFYTRSAQTACENNPGFTYILHSSGESVCLHISVGRVEGEEAMEACESIAPGGRLYVMKTSARFDILVANRQGNSDSVWVGLRKSPFSDSFFWDDGEELLPYSEMWNILWNKARDQPDIGDDQRCVGSYGGAINLHDLSCTSYYGRYACEIPLPRE